MGRKPRVWIPNQFYHVVSRGNRREPLFDDPGDYLTFFYIMKQVYASYAFEIVAFCLMTNHYHLQIRSKDHSLSKVIGLCNKRYADYYNAKNRVSGHLFEKRYYDSIILDKEGMLRVSQYIHLNPVEAKMVKSPEDYSYSSYQAFLYGNEKEHELLFLNVMLLLDYFSDKTNTEKAHAYHQYVIQ